MGHLAFAAGLSHNAYEVGRKWLSRFPAGLGLATILGYGAFAGACGSSVATAATMGRVAIPEMNANWILCIFIFHNPCGVPDEINQWVAGLSLPPFLIVAMLLLFFVPLGCFLDPFSILVITLLITHPVVVETSGWRNL